ncbi:MAG: hypothetical protein ABWY56_14835 [Propionibacteriaceae bacterium]
MDTLSARPHAKASYLVRALLVLTLAAGLSAWLWPTAPADAHPSRERGRLTFMREDAHGFWQVWVSNADLSGARQLTFGDVGSGWPVLSPDGRRIAFDSDRSDPDPADGVAVYDIFVMNADGTGVKQLTDSKRGPSGDAAWSRDGSRIAFQSDGGAYPSGQGIYVMHADGSHVKRITTLPSGFDVDHSARFSPDGKRLVFTRDAPNNAGSALFTTDLKGRTKQITSFDIRAGDAVWSPRGERIVFEAEGTEPGGPGDIYAINANGRQLDNLTNYRNAGDGSSDPVWSPDGRKILFLQRLQTSGESHRLGLAVMRADGSGRHFIRDTPDESHQPDWQNVRPRHWGG